MAKTTDTPHAGGAHRERIRPRHIAPPADRVPAGVRSRMPGGTDGNERLTVLSGVLLLVLFAGIGITILRMGQLLWLHLFLGLTLAGPVALKLASTGYRFSMYYLGDRRYRRKGPPRAALRMLAPLLVLCTLGVLATGLTLLLLGPQARQPVLLLHKLFFFAWLAVCGIHLLAHLPEVMGVLSRAPSTHRAASPSRTTSTSGGRLRAFALIASVAAGLALATSLTGLFHLWTG